MRRIFLTVPLLGVLMLGWFVADFYQGSNDIAGRPIAAIADQEGARSNDTAPVQLADRPVLACVVSDRTPVETFAPSEPPSSPPSQEPELTDKGQEDAYVDPQDEIEDLQGEVLMLQFKNEYLLRELTIATRDLECMQLNGKTHYGAFLQSEAGKQVESPKVLQGVKNWLRQFPVYLSEDEAAWLVARESPDGWDSFHESSERVLIWYLDPARLARELPPERVARLRLEYAAKPGVFP